MRQLTDLELQAIRDAIKVKEISSAEILIEVYDHYITHLQGYSEEEFQWQLAKLEQKFTLPFCKALQYRFNKQARKDIGSSQWEIVKAYFCRARWLYLLGILVVVFFVANQVRNEKEVSILMFSPFILLILFLGVFWIKNFRKLRPIKNTFKGIGYPINSALALPIMERIYLPVLSCQFFIIYLPKVILPTLFVQPLLSAFAALMTVVMTLYAISLFEVWKIKSKSSLV